MNQKQKDYAITRINTMYHKKKDVVVKQNTKEAIILSTTEKISLIASKKVRLFPEAILLTKKGYRNPTEWFDFSIYEAKKTVNEKIIFELMEPVKALKTRAIDTIMLGDSEEALEIISEFEKAILNRRE